MWKKVDRFVGRHMSPVKWTVFWVAAIAGIFCLMVIVGLSGWLSVLIPATAICAFMIAGNASRIRGK